MTSPLKLYLSGPMKGLANNNFEAFHAETKRLRALGYTVVNPAELFPDQDTKREVCMKGCIQAILTCDAVAVMSSFRQTNSQGVLVECTVARACGIPLAYAHAIRESADKVGQIQGLF